MSPESYRDTHDGTIEFMLKKNQAWSSNMEAFKKIGNLPSQVLLTQVMMKVKK